MQSWLLFYYFIIHVTPLTYMIKTYHRAVIRYVPAFCYYYTTTLPKVVASEATSAFDVTYRINPCAFSLTFVKNVAIWLVLYGRSHAFPRSFRSCTGCGSLRSSGCAPVYLFGNKTVPGPALRQMVCWQQLATLAAKNIPLQKPAGLPGWNLRQHPGRCPALEKAHQVDGLYIITKAHRNDGLNSQHPIIQALAP